ncbi:MAG: transporter substrate-binding domain-containing protein [Gordonia sp. (in: high G+C Gram-positive bacteria)]
MKYRRTTIATLLTATVISSLSGCTSTDSSSSPASGCTPEWTFPTIHHGALTVATVDSLPYVEVEPGSNEAKGIDSDLLTNFAKRACLKVDFKSLGGPAAVAAMTQGTADVAAGGWYSTPERGKKIGQTDPVWYDYNAIASKEKLSTIDALKGKTVGVVAGSLYVQPLAAVIGDAKVKQYQTMDAVLRDISAGRLDAGLGTSSELGYQVHQRADSGITVTPVPEDAHYTTLTQRGMVNFPYTKSNSKLGDALQNFIAATRKDGTVAGVLTKYGITNPKNITGS